MDRQIRLLLVDDRTTEAAALGIRLAAEPDCEVLGVLGGADARPDGLPATSPDLLLVDDCTLHRRGAIGLLGSLRAAHPGLRSLVLTREDGDEEQLPAAAAGPVGRVSRVVPVPSLAEAVRHIHGSGVLFRAAVLLRLLHDGTAPPGRTLPRPVRPLFSARERTALAAVAEGLAARDTAERMMSWDLGGAT